MGLVISINLLQLESFKLKIYCGKQKCLEREIKVVQLSRNAKLKEDGSDHE